ncbi:MAG: hypothetical protein JSV12_00670 [Candidatus Bathyarchaeota archaeon]|nr:MAG: hypothetical protein JSV12_00670 [Candidatus Bathyarchaeota archaeon]
MTLLDDFKKAAKEIALDLEMNVEKIQIRHVETSKLGLDYTAHTESAKGFDFHLRTVTENEDPTKGEMRASLTICFKEGVSPYHFHENIDYIKRHSNFLSRWVSWTIFNFRQIHQKVSLETLFHDMVVRVYGTPKYSSPAEEEAELLFHGILATQESKVLIYRFRHIRRGDLYRSFSYAVHVNPKKGMNFWVVFPDNSGLDSGGAYHSYLHFENLIQMIRRKLEVEVRTYDVEYDELDRFLLRRAESFFSIFREDSLDILYRFSQPSKVLEGSEAQYEKFTDRLEAKEYAQALRDLRALVQQAQENVAKLKNLDYSSLSRQNIHNLADFLIRKKQLDGRLLPWFDAFASIANIASHRDFPTKQDMQDFTLRTRILLTFYLGIQLLQELDAIVRPKIEWRTPSIAISLNNQ